MEILGLGYVAAFVLIGSFLGRVLGALIGVKGNVGGVGIAMLLLVLVTEFLEAKNRPLSEGTQRGIKLLSALFIPVIVAMTARLNVVGATEGGAVALVAGASAVIVGLVLLVPLISKVTGK
ncbi:MAG: malonate transporter subunit MadL [Candidatus Bipolaricaulota bacterium]